MRGMGKWLVGAYALALAIYLLVHSSVSLVFVLQAALLIFLGGAAVFTAFAHLCARASMPRPAKDYLAKDGGIRVPLAVSWLTWFAFGVLIVGWIAIFAGVFLFRP